jgi:hypothetical protein
MEQTIYVVIGVAGEYSDRNEWVVCAYTDEALAQEHVVKAGEAANTLTLAYQHLDYEEETEVFTEDGELKPGANLYDATMQLNSTYGTRYHYTKTTIRTALPTPPTERTE